MFTLKVFGCCGMYESLGSGRHRTWFTSAVSRLVRNGTCFLFLEAGEGGGILSLFEPSNECKNGVNGCSRTDNPQPHQRTTACISSISCSALRMRSVVHSRQKNPTHQKPKNSRYIPSASPGRHSERLFTHYTYTSSFCIALLYDKAKTIT